MATRALPAEHLDDQSPRHSSTNNPYPPEDSLLLKKSSSISIPRAATPQKPKSKLSALASSRASSVSSASTHSKSYSVGSSSNVTYPPLRPSSESVLSFNSEAPSTVTGSSSLSSHVRRAIGAALELEKLDATQEDSKPPSEVADAQRIPMPGTPVPPASASPAPAFPEPQLASPPQAISAPGVSTSPVPLTSPPRPASVASSGKQPSKLALLAQAKAQSQSSHWTPKPKKFSIPTPGLSLHKSHTEYLTPIANGPTATTAITTSYQSLGNLAKMPRLPPSYPPAAQVTSPTSPGAKKPSKLAMKSRKQQQAVEPEPEPEQEPLAVDPIFVAASPRSRASPSAFASLLVDNMTLQDKDYKRRYRKEGKHSKKRSEGSSRHGYDIPPAPLSPLQGFAFDIPSPDDTVFQARRGTSLAPRSTASANTHSSPASRVSHSSSAKLAAVQN